MRRSSRLHGLRRCAALLASSLAGSAAACEGLAVTDAWIREPPPGASAVAVYMTLTNTGNDALAIDTLTSPAFAHGMLHETVRDGERVRMQSVARLPLAPGGRATLAPGALHGMLMKPREGMPRAGERIEIVIGCGEQSTHLTLPVARDAP